jgi:hypothetical protein
VRWNTCRFWPERQEAMPRTAWSEKNGVTSLSDRAQQTRPPQVEAWHREAAFHSGSPSHRPAGRHVSPAVGHNSGTLPACLRRHHSRSVSARTGTRLESCCLRGQTLQYSRRRRPNNAPDTSFNSSGSYREVSTSNPGGSGTRPAPDGVPSEKFLTSADWPDTMSLVRCGENDQCFPDGGSRHGTDT